MLLLVDVRVLVEYEYTHLYAIFLVMSTGSVSGRDTNEDFVRCYQNSSGKTVWGQHMLDWSHF